MNELAGALAQTVRPAPAPVWAREREPALVPGLERVTVLALAQERVTVLALAQERVPALLSMWEQKSAPALELVRALAWAAMEQAQVQALEQKFALKSCRLPPVGMPLYGPPSSELPDALCSSKRQPCNGHSGSCPQRYSRAARSVAASYLKGATPQTSQKTIHRQRDDAQAEGAKQERTPVRCERCEREAQARRNAKARVQREGTVSRRCRV